MRIPERVRKVLGGAHWGIAGSRSKDQMPAGHVAWGAHVESDLEHVGVFIPRPFAGPLEQNHADNAAFVLSVNDPMANESYQLKGKSVAVRPPANEELAFQKTHTELTVALFSQMVAKYAIPMNQLGKLPSLYVRFKVEEIFDQSPGPKAGQRMTEES